jgi:hypothetical protein
MSVADVTIRLEECIDEVCLRRLERLLREECCIERAYSGQTPPPPDGRLRRQRDRAEHDRSRHAQPRLARFGARALAPVVHAPKKNPGRSAGGVLRLAYASLTP